MKENMFIKLLYSNAFTQIQTIKRQTSHPHSDEKKKNHDNRELPTLKKFFAQQNNGHDTNNVNKCALLLILLGI